MAKNSIVGVGGIMLPSSGEINISHPSSLNQYVSINTQDDVSTGKGVLMGAYAPILATSYNCEGDENTINAQGMYLNWGVKISDDVSKITQAVILGRVKIGRGCTIADVAVIPNDVELHLIMAGGPYKDIGRRTGDDR